MRDDQPGKGMTDKGAELVDRQQNFLHLHVSTCSKEINHPGPPGWLMCHCVANFLRPSWRLPSWHRRNG